MHQSVNPCIHHSTTPSLHPLPRSVFLRLSSDDLGQMVEVLASLSAAKALLLGENGFQPYERAVALRTPQRCHPVLKTGSELRLFFGADDFEAALERGVSSVPSVTLASYEDRIHPSPAGGPWLESSEPGRLPARLIGQKRLELDLSETPLHTKAVRRVHEDAAGNLWFEMYAYAWSGHAFVRRSSEVRLREHPRVERLPGND
jgi:hypothetical protein